MSKIPGSAHLNISMGVVAFLGGVAGFRLKASRISLVAGTTVGTLLMGSSYLICNDREYEGHMLASGTCAIWAISMGRRFLVARSVSSGLLTALAVAATAYNGKKTIDWAPGTSAAAPKIK